jgi:hypothetical protein
MRKITYLGRQVGAELLAMIDHWLASLEKGKHA